VIEEEEKIDGDRKIRRKVATVIVRDDQLTLAIGNRGLNVSLAAKLTNCKIDIKSEKDSAEKNRAMLTAILGD
jgi:N utilization substance protein A